MQCKEEKRAKSANEMKSLDDKVENLIQTRNMTDQLERIADLYRDEISDYLFLSFKNI